MIERPGEFLLAKRPEGKPYPGYWEFPGGKIEPGEDPRAGRWWWEEAQTRECGLHLAADGRHTRGRAADINSTERSPA